MLQTSESLCLVSAFATICAVKQYLIATSPLSTFSRGKWYLMVMCLLPPRTGHGAVARQRNAAPGVLEDHCSLGLAQHISHNNSQENNASHTAAHNTMYSASAMRAPIYLLRFPP